MENGKISTNAGSTVLLMLSGGRDSFLSACNLLEQGYYLKMITYDNGCTIQSSSAGKCAERIIKAYGSEKAEFLGVHYIASLFREFFNPYFNMTTSELLSEFGDITISQLNCLLCRTSMYIYSLQVCKEQKITAIAEGARKSQGFVVELDGMTERYKYLLEQYGVELLLPVYDLDSDWDRKNELLWRKYKPKTDEAQCLLGVPIDRPISQNIIDGIHAFYDKAILPRIKKRKLIERPLCKNSCDEINER